MIAVRTQKLSGYSLTTPSVNTVADRSVGQLFFLSLTAPSVRLEPDRPSVRDTRSATTADQIAVLTQRGRDDDVG